MNQLRPQLTVRAVARRRSGPLATAIAFTASAMIAIFSGPAASAAVYYWDFSNASGLTSGSTTWDAGTTSAWATSASPGTTAPGLWTDGNDAYFQTGGANTATITSSVSANSLTQTTNSTATTITGGTLIITGAAGIVNSGNSTLTINSALTLGNGTAQTYTFNAGSNITIGGVIGENGTAGILKTGAGTLTLKALNTYTGTTTVNGGLLNLNFPTTKTNVLSSSSALALGGGGLFMNQANSTTATQTINGVTVNAGASYISTLRGGSATMVLNLGNITQGITPGSVGGTLAIIPPSSGHKVTSTATNVNNIIGGWVVIGVGGATPTDFAKANGSATLIGAPTYTADTWAAGNNTNVTATSAPASDSTTNSLRFATNSSSTLTLSGVNTITSGGILVAGAVKTGSDQVIAGGTLKGSSDGALYIHQFSGEGNLNVGTGALGTGGNLTINSIIADNGGATALVKTGGSPLILGGANSFTGGIYLNQGTLQLATGGSLNSNLVTFGSNATVSPNYSGIMIAAPTLTLNGVGATIGGLQMQTGYVGQTPIVQNANATAATLTISGAGTNTFSGIIQDGTGGGALSLTANGSGTQVLSGANTYTGATDVQNGSMQLTGSLSTSTTLNIGNGTNSGKFILGSATAAVNQTVAGLTTAGSGSANAIVGGNAAVSTLTANIAGTNTYGGTLGGVGTNENSLALTKSGVGTLTLSGTNSYTGNTTLSGGTLNISNAANTTTGVFIIGSGATLNLSSFSDYGVASAMGSRLAASESTAADSATGGIGLHFTGGTLQYTGSTAQSTNRQIRLRTNTTNTIDASGTGSGSTLSFTYSGTNTNLFDNGGTRTLNLTGSNTGNNLFALNIQDQTTGGAANTSLVKSGLGTWIVSNSHNEDATVGSPNGVYAGFSGGTTVNSGILIPQAPGALGAAGKALTLAGGTLDIQTDTTINALNTTVSANSTIVSDKLTAATAGITQTLGTLSIGANTLSITRGTNATGTTAAVAFGATTFTAAPTFSIGAGSTLSLAAVTNSTYTATITGPGNFAQTGVWGNGAGGITFDSSFSGVATLNQVNTYTGGTIVSAGTLNINNSSALGTGTLTINTANTTFDNTSGGLISITNNITSTNNVIFAGTNALTTSGIYAYSNSARILTVNGSGTLTVGSVVNSTGGTGNLRKSGSGTLSITGTGPSTAAVELNGGTLIIGDKASLGGSSFNLIAAGTLQSSADLTGANKIANAVGLSTFTLTLGGANNFELGGVISSTGALTKSDANTVTLSGANTYTGNTSVTGGTLQIDGSYAVAGGGTTSQLQIGNGASTNGTVIIGSGAGTLTFGGDGYNSAAQVGTSGGTGALTLNGGTVNIAGTTGTTTAAALNIGVQIATAAGTGTVTVNSGTLNIGSRILMGANNASANGTLTIAGGAVNLGYTGNLAFSNNQGGVLRMGNGTSTVNLNGGTLSLYAFQSDSSTAANTVINFNGGTLKALGTPNYFFSNATNTAVGTFTTKIQSLGAIIDTNSFNITIPTALVEDGTSTGGGLTKNGTGTLTLSGANTYTGVTTVNAGTLKLGATGALGNGTNNTSGVTVNGSAIFDLGGISPTANVALVLNSNANGFDVGAFLNSGAAATYGGAITLQQQTRFGGSGAMLLNGAITGNGVKIIKDSTGLLELQNSGTVTLGAFQGNRGNLQVDSGTTLNFTSIEVGTGNSVGAGLILNGGTVTSSGLTRFGQGTGAAGSTLALNSGTLTVPALTKGSLTFNVTFNGGTLKANADSNTFFTGATSAKIQNGGAVIDDGGFAIIVDQALIEDTGSTGGGLTKSGIGTLTLSGANTYSGATTVSAGTLKLGAVGALGDGTNNTSGVSVTDGAVLDLNGITPTANAVALTLNGTGISSGGALTNSSGTAVTYGGLLTLGSASSIIATTGDISLSNTGTITGAFGLTIGGASNTSISGIIGTTSGTLTKQDAGTLTLSGANTYTGATSVTGGTLTLDTTGVIGGGASGTAVTVNGGILTSNSTVATTGGIAGTSSLTITSGTANLNTANNFSGATSVTGTLLLANADAVKNSAVTLNNGATLQLRNDSSTTFTAKNNVVAISGVTANPSITLEVNNNGSNTGKILTLANGISYDAPSITAGTHTTIINVTGGNDYALAVPTVTFNNGNSYGSGGSRNFVLDINPTSANVSLGNVTLTGSGSRVTVALTLDGTSVGNVVTGAISLPTGRPVTKAGSGTWTLSGANTYTGATTVSNGMLQVDVDQALGTAATGTTVADGAALKLNAVNYATAEALTLNGSGISNGGALVNVGTSTYAGQVTAASNATINTGGGNLTFTGGLVKDGKVLTITGGGVVNVNTVGISGASAGSDLVVDGTTVNLDVASSYNGPTYIRSTATAGTGVVNATVVGALPTASAVTMDDSGLGSSQLNLTANQAIASLAGAASSLVNLNANTLTIGAASGVTTFAGIISGTGGSLVKDNGSTLVLTGANSYTGTTTVSGGTLVVNGSLATSGVTVNPGAILSGTGSIVGTINLNGTVSPGGDGMIGTISQAGNAAWDGAGAYVWEVKSVSVPGGAQSGTGTDFDLLDITGTLTITNGFKIEVTGLDALNAVGTPANWDNNSNYSWAIAKATDGISGDVGFLAALKTNMSLLNFLGGSTNLSRWSFSLTPDNHSLLLNYAAAAIPEPGTLGLLAFGALALLGRRKKR